MKYLQTVTQMSHLMLTKLRTVFQFQQLIIYKLSRPYTVFKDFPGPGKTYNFFRTFKDFQCPVPTLNLSIIPFKIQAKID